MTTAVAPIDDAAAAELRFLETLRDRVAWPARRAAELRSMQPAPPFDVLEFRALTRLVDAHPYARRFAEWRMLLDELEPLVEPDGRLPAMLERLVFVVFADLL